jgi:hypothetical protein
MNRNKENIISNIISTRDTVALPGSSHCERWKRSGSVCCTRNLLLNMKHFLNKQMVYENSK